MSDDRLKIFVATPDSYSDVFEIFLQCYKLNCSDLPYELVVATNTKTYDEVRCIPNGLTNDSWEARAIPVLRKIKSEYVLIMDDDFFITGKIDYREIESILSQMDRYGISYCALTNFLTGRPVENGSSLVWVKKATPYARNLQVGIFRRDYLLDILEKIEDTHLQEAKWNEEAYYANKNEYYDDIVSCTKVVVPCVHGVAMGKWFPSAINVVKKMGVQVNSDREFLSKQEETRIKIFNKFGKKLSPQQRAIIKKLLKRVGFNFITNY